MANKTKQSTLKDVAKVYKTKALQALNPGVPYKSYRNTSSKAFKTGNLFNKVASSNKTDTMFRYDKQKETYSFVFNVAPSGAPYGKFVHYGTRYKGKRPFAEIAAESPEFKKAVDEFVGSVADDKMKDIFKGFDERFKDAGFKVS